MVVVDSSALIPLAWVGRLDLVTATFDEVRTTEAVAEEVLTAGKRGTAVLDDFLEDVSVLETPREAEEVASLEGIAPADASVILAADDEEAILLANDKGLIEVARSHDIESWWVTTLLLKCTKDGTITSATANDILYDLVDEGMNLHPKVYTQVQRKLRELGE
ncbi:hypothetical protein [Natrinema marinum]|uniref:hypothetical protein n=1 Tax=Natrinema marinum TaxID=2961598 RepID=UPI0020C93609|nr:hypothetical protein [Natrinema marinum]